MTAHRYTPDEIRRLIQSDSLGTFYNSRAWKRLRLDVLASDKHECQVCKSRGRYTRADHVHHVNYLRRHPELAYSKTAPDGTRNLISVCKACHEEIHEHRAKADGSRFVTEERW